MREYINLEGNESAVIENMMEEFHITKEQSEQFLEFIEYNQEILSEDEMFQHCNGIDETSDDIIQLVISEGKYYINLKRTTFYVVIWLLENKLINEDITTPLEMIGLFYGGRVLGKPDEYTGEKCILLELAKKRKKGADEKLLKKYKGECCNNHYECNHNKNGKCDCTIDTVREICDQLVEKGMVVKKRGKYFYQI